MFKWLDFVSKRTIQVHCKTAEFLYLSSRDCCGVITNTRIHEKISRFIVTHPVVCFIHQNCIELYKTLHKVFNSIAAYPLVQQKFTYSKLNTVQNFNPCKINLKLASFTVEMYYAMHNCTLICI